jgi:hypothetical protein
MTNYEDYDIQLLLKNTKKYFDTPCGSFGEEERIEDIHKMMDENRWNMIFDLCGSEDFYEMFIHEFFPYYIIENLKNKKISNINQLIEKHGERLFTIMTPDKIKNDFYDEEFFNLVEEDLIEEDFIAFYKIPQLRNLLSYQQLKKLSISSNSFRKKDKN